jgi:LPPG:FO 2-phospho-L-lactate transferase
MSDIMEEGGGSNKGTLLIGETESPAGNIGQEHRPKRVFETGVVGAGIHKIGETELPDIAETLERGGIEQGKGKILHLNITMDRVLDDLHKFTKESSYTWHKSILVMITFLSGGTGTPKLLRGMQKVMDRHEIAVIVNTAEDIWISGNHISPDVDTVMYLFAGILNTETWWGVRNDTYITHDETTRLGIDEFLTVGDKDRAVHIARGEMMRNGMRLTNATRILCDRFGVREHVLPMTDTEVTTQVKTDLGLMHFQEYWIRAKGKIEIQGVERTFNEPPVATEEALMAIAASDAVVIGPSNPITSIMPILSCEGVKEALRGKIVIGVSPFIGNEPVSGPAAALMKATGFEPNSIGTFNCYGGLLDVFIQDVRDPIEASHSSRFDTLMVDEDKSVALAAEVLRLIGTC